jgi:hypothetical protein
MTRPSMHSATNHLTRPIIAYPLPAQRDGLPGLSSPIGVPRTLSGFTQTFSHAKA